MAVPFWNLQTFLVDKLSFFLMFSIFFYCPLSFSLFFLSIVGLFGCSPSTQRPVLFCTQRLLLPGDVGTYLILLSSVDESVKSRKTYIATNRTGWKRRASFFTAACRPRSPPPSLFPYPFWNENLLRPFHQPSEESSQIYRRIVSI
ncbi:unnamed protein product [Cuscuta epithymum]|nr:unnamed protein product [Cuscuta epithymum]